MRTTLLTLFSAAVGLTGFTASAQPLYHTTQDDGGRVTTLGGEGLDFTLGGALDHQGHLYIVGSTGSRWVRQTRCAPEDQPCSRGFLLKLDVHGNPMWGRAISPSGRANGASEVVYDAIRDRVIVAGAYRPPNGPGFQVNVFVAAYTTEGKPIWRKDFDHTDSRSDRATVTDIALGPDGSIHLVGDTGGDIAGTSHTGKNYNGAHNGWDVFVLKLTPKGEVAFSNIYGVPDPDPERVPTQFNDYGKGIAVDAEGRIYVNGTTDGDLIKRRKRKGHRAFLLTLDPKGKRAKAHYRALDDITPQHLTFDDDGHLYQLGLAQKGHRAIEGPLGAADLVLERISRTNSPQWSVRFGTPRREYGAGLVVGPDGHLYVGGAAGLHDKPDGLLYSFTTEGKMRWRRTVRSKGSDEPTSVTASLGGVALIGWTAGSLEGLPRAQGPARYEPADGVILRYPLSGPEGLPAGNTVAAGE